MTQNLSAGEMRFRMSKADWKRIAYLQKRMGMNASQVLRQLLLAEVEKQKRRDRTEKEKWQPQKDSEK